MGCFWFPFSFWYLALATSFNHDTFTINAHICLDKPANIKASLILNFTHTSMYICSELSISYCPGTRCLPGNQENPWGQHLPIQASRLTLHISLCPRWGFLLLTCSVSSGSSASATGHPGLSRACFGCHPAHIHGARTPSAPAPCWPLGTSTGKAPSLLQELKGSGRPWLWPQKSHLQPETNATGNKCCLGSPINLRRWKYRKGRRRNRWSFLHPGCNTRDLTEGKN